MIAPLTGSDNGKSPSPQEEMIYAGGLRQRNVKRAAFD
jgi:hypothetical protein